LSSLDNIVSINYDPGALKVNQLNCIMLMVATAHKNAGTSGTLARWDMADASDPVDALVADPLRQELRCL